ncbi:P-loop containing nucleoside triphosphate hydrolase protein [Xylaria flabelliformis]|nr:P-loop containing nucleoside triphosphate hydrolase protein [Xylaria flabelliformis]
MALDLLFWAYPLCLWIGYIVSYLYRAVRAKQGIVLFNSNRRKNIDGIVRIFNVLIIISTASFTCHFEIEHSTNTKCWTSENYIASTLAVGLFYLAGLFPDADAQYTHSDTDLHMWVISVVYETAWLCYCAFPKIRSQSSWDATLLAFGVLKICLFSSMILIYFWDVLRSRGEIRINTPGENRPFLNGTLADDRCEDYGTRGQTVNLKEYGNKGDAQSTTWVEYALGFRKLIPFLWPSESRLQLRVILCFALLLAQRIVNIFAPHQLGIVVDSLGAGQFPHRHLLLYVFLRGIQGQQGIIGALRAILWIPVSQSTFRRLSSEAFQHILCLSLDFHQSKRVGEVISALSKGGALNTFLDALIFQLFPMVADLWIAAAYFYFYFNAFYSLMVIAATWFYIYITIYMAKYRGRARREMTKREREMDAAKTDALLSYETVHHCGAVSMEISRYEKLIALFQRAEYHVWFSLNILNVVQHSVFTIATVLLCYLNVYEISKGIQEVSMFVTLITYIAQLQMPLSFFGSFYTMVQNNLVDAERMLELFHEEAVVTDHECSVDLPACRGAISFSNVSFEYDRRGPALNRISFEIPPGTSAAIVGESGSGKSTILKLIFRFYDPSGGEVKLDSVNTRDIRIDNLRSHIGVVAQDTILFNDTMMYNLLYANPRASQLEFEAACRAASIHEMISRLPLGYSTVVGERGLKLSGGERQRVAIARALLQSPRILLLDEATSSLDTKTEREVQASLDKISKGRTTITIAHRLSTITKADQILVLHRGEIVERGTHLNLLASGGHYSKMWEKQRATESD